MQHMGELESASVAPKRERRGWTLRSYLVALVVLFIITATGGALYGWRQAEHDQIHAARAQAAFAAGLAANELTSDIASEQTSVQQLASDPSIAQFLTTPQQCSLTFDLPGGADAGHLDLIRPDGAVTCSSRNGQVRPGAFPYRTAPWLSRALKTAQFAAPETDPATGWTVMLITQPVAPYGLVAGFVNLKVMAPALARLFSGPSTMEFMVLTADQKTVLARSIDPDRWVGTSTANTPFAKAGDTTQRPDLNGTVRLYGEDKVAPANWRVLAGASRAEALNATHRLIQHELLIISIGLLAALAATVVVHQRITRPIATLRSTVRSAAESTDADLVRVSGPSEVVELADEFGAMLTAVDRELTERRRAEESARQLERNYRQLFEINPFPMIVFDAATLDVLEVNNAAAEHYGYTVDEFGRMNLCDLHQAEEVPGLREAMDAAGAVHTFGPVAQMKKSGEMIQVRISSHALCFHDVPARCAVMDDITAREQLERRLRQSQRMESLGQLAGGVAHDFNNLLNIILGYTDFANDQIEVAAGADAQWQPVREDLARVRNAAERASGLTHQLLMFARADVVQPRTLDLNEVVGEVKEMLSCTLGEHIRLHSNLADDLLSVRADPGQIGQVLVNLAVNARDAMPTGGILVIETDNFMADQPAAAVMPGVSRGRYVRLRVSDTGVGMTKEAVEHAFEPFYTTKPKGKGTGLGLATTYGIVTQAGGYVHLYSELGIGTTVTVLLPVTDDDATAPPAPVASANVAGDGETVLVVEDEDSLRLLTQRILTRNNYRVVTAGDGVEALDYVRTHPSEKIDLLVTDVVMPHMSGPDLAQRVQSTFPGLPVIYVSGYPQAVLSAHKTLPPDVALLTKPFAESTLLYSVRHVLRAGHVASANPRRP